MVYDEIYYDKLKTAELFNSECALCGKNIKDQDTRKRKRKRIAFTFHHLFIIRAKRQLRISNILMIIINIFYLLLEKTQTNSPCCTINATLLSHGH